ncbi:hypothetical protein SGLAM104S_07267 [Streptomyces glaucescens]
MTPTTRCWKGLGGSLREAGVPVVMHCGSGPAPGRFTGPEPIGRLLARHPRLRLIVAHMGMPEYAEFLALADTYRRCGSIRRWRSPTSARGSPRSRRAGGGLADLGDRILLGTDFPNIPYPYVHQLEALERLGLGEEWLRAICSRNAEALFGSPV